LQLARRRPAPARPAGQGVLLVTGSCCAPFGPDRRTGSANRTLRSGRRTTVTWPRRAGTPSGLFAQAGPVSRAAEDLRRSPLSLEVQGRPSNGEIPTFTGARGASAQQARHRSGQPGTRASAAAGMRNEVLRCRPQQIGGRCAQQCFAGSRWPRRTVAARFSLRLWASKCRVECATPRAQIAMLWTAGPRKITKGGAISRGGADGFSRCATVSVTRPEGPELGTASQ
jgi:hypothetical protein